MALLEVLENRIIPWIEKKGVQRFVIADDSVEKHPLPDGIVMTRAKLKGRRITLPASRGRGHTDNFIAEWPDAGLAEMRLPFIACVVSGWVNYQVGERVFHCTEGDFVLIPPGVPFPGGDTLPVVVDEHVPDIISFNTWENHSQCCVCHGTEGNHLFPNHGTVQLLDLLLDELLARRPGYERVSANTFLAFLALLSREVRENHYFRTNQGILQTDTDEPKIDPIMRVQRHIQSHLNEPMTIDEAARRAMMSRTQFTKRFRQATGQSFLEYITHCRLDQAKVLLRDTDWAFSTIAEFVGYQGTTRLRRIFNHDVGMTLTQFRAESRLKQREALEPLAESYPHVDIQSRLTPRK